MGQFTSQQRRIVHVLHIHEKVPPRLVVVTWQAGQNMYGFQDARFKHIQAITNQRKRAKLIDMNGHGYKWVKHQWHPKTAQIFVRVADRQNLSYECHALILADIRVLLLFESWPALREQLAPLKSHTDRDYSGTPDQITQHPTIPNSSLLHPTAVIYSSKKQPHTFGHHPAQQLVSSVDEHCTEAEFHKVDPSVYQWVALSWAVCHFW